MTEPTAPAPVEKPSVVLLAADKPVPREITLTPGPIEQTDLLFSKTPAKPRRSRTTRTRKTPDPAVAVAATPAPSWVVSAQSPAAQDLPIADSPVTETFAPIETRYAGCRFRSRLEARWAVWLDHLGIKWQYEPDTFLVGPKPRQRAYLPDFYLPEGQIWIEVKGDENALDYRKMIDAADPTGLPFRLGSPTVPEWPTLQVRMVLLGEVPRQPGFHVALGVLLGKQVVRQLVVPFCDMKVIGKPNLLGKPHGHSLAPTFYPINLGHDIGEGGLDPQPTGLLTSFGYGPPCPQVEGAYTAARSARFEHGESG